MSKYPSASALTRVGVLLMVALSGLGGGCGDCHLDENGKPTEGCTQFDLLLLAMNELAYGDADSVDATLASRTPLATWESDSLHWQPLEEDLPSGSEFGRSVCIGPQTARTPDPRGAKQDQSAPSAVFVGAPSGEGRVLYRSMPQDLGLWWGQTQELARPDGARLFGWDIAYISSAEAYGVAVGSPDAVVPGVNQRGAVYLFEYEAGEEPEGGSLRHTGTLAPPGNPSLPADASIYVSFGHALDGGKDLVVVGTGSESGGVFVFERDGVGEWDQSAHLTGRPDGHFGYEVAYSPPLIFIGEPDAILGPQIGGRIYVFRDDGAGWHEVAVISDDSPSFGRHFATRRVNGDLLADVELVATTTRANVDDTGTVRVYRSEASMGSSAPSNGLGEEWDELFVGRDWPWAGDVHGLCTLEPGTSGTSVALVAASVRPWQGADYTDPALVRMTSATRTSARIFDSQPQVPEPEANLFVGISALAARGELIESAEAAPVAETWIAMGFADSFQVNEEGRRVPVNYVQVARGHPTGLTNPSKSDEDAAVDSVPYLALRGTPGSTGSGSAEFTVPRPLRAPFRWEVSGGSFDVERRAGLAGARIELQLAAPEGAPVEAYRLWATFTDPGWSVAAYDEDDVPLGETVTISAAGVDLALEHDGATLALEARAEGAGSYERVATVTPSGPGPFVQRYAATGIAPGAELGVQSAETIATGEPLVPLSSEDSLRDCLVQAVEQQLFATGELGAAGADPGPARERLDAAAGWLDEALVFCEEMVAAGKKKAGSPRAVRRDVKKARKRVRKALAKLDAGKKAKAIERQLTKALKFESKALRRLDRL